MPWEEHCQADGALGDGIAQYPLTLWGECRQAYDVLEDGSGHYPLTPEDDAREDGIAH